MTPKQKFAAALDRKPIPGRVPTFELLVSCTMEVFGRVHPLHRNYSQWSQMQPAECRRHIHDLADTYIAIAEHYEHSAICVHQISHDETELTGTVNAIREKTGGKYFLLCIGDASFAIPSGEQLEAFAYRLADEPEAVHAEAARRVDDFIARGERLVKECRPDGMILTADYCFNSGPFLSPAQFEEFIAPYLAREIKSYRDQGLYVIKHTDGNIMPILEPLVQAGPHALHSLDPQGGVDIAEVKRRVGNRVALCGNVNCGLLDTGTDEEVAADVRRALRQGMPGGGYVFCSSNSIYTGIRPDRYQLMLDIWRQEGNYPAVTV